MSILINRETRVIYFTNKKPGVRIRGYYVMKHFANHTADSRYLATKRDGLKGVDTMAFRQDDRVTLWIINNTEQTHEKVSIALPAATLADEPIARLSWGETTPTEGEATTLTRADATSLLNHIGPKSVTALTFKVK